MPQAFLITKYRYTRMKLLYRDEEGCHSHHIDHIQTNRLSLEKTPQTRQYAAVESPK